jgi:hypothetical protein
MVQTLRNPDLDREVMRIKYGALSGPSEISNITPEGFHDGVGFGFGMHPALIGPVNEGSGAASPELCFGFLGILRP